MSNKKDKYKINYSTYVSGGRAMGNSGSAIRGGLSSAFSRVKATSNKENTSSNKSSSGGVSGLIKSSVGSTVTSNKSSNSYDSSSKSNNNLDYNVKKYMGQRGGTFGDKSYTKIGDDFYLKANPYSGIDMKKNNKPTLLKENQYNISEENREKINKGKIESYIKGINPYSAPPKNIRDAKAKESVESLMNSIQKKKNTIFKNQSEDNERGITDQGISQVTSNIKPYGMDQRSAVNTKNNSLYQAYPGYGSRVTSVGYFRKNVEHKEKNMDNYVYEHNSIPGQPTSKDFTKKYLKVEPTTKNTTKVQKTANVGDFRQNVDSKSNKEKAYGYEHNSIPGQPTSKDFTKKYLKVKPTSKNTTKVQKTANVGDFRQNVDSKSNKEKAYGYEHISIPGQPTSRNFTKEHLKVKSKSKNTKLQNPVNTSDIMNYYYVPNGKFNKDEFNQQMNDYKSYLSSDIGNFRQNMDTQEDKRKEINDLLYKNNSIPGQPNKQRFIDPYIGTKIPEYESFEDKENEAKEMEKECSEDPNREMYIKKGESIESNNTNAGFIYDTNPMKAYEEDHENLKKMIEGHTHMKYKKGYDYYSKEEKDTSNYILGKYGPKAQAEYLENIAYRQEQKKGQEISNSLKDADLLSKNIFAFLNGFVEKPTNAIQGIVATGENKNVFLPQGINIGMNEYIDNYANGFDKALMKGSEFLGQTAAGQLASAVHPAFGFAFNAAADYGEEYKNSLMGVSPNGGKDDVKIAQENALGNMTSGIASNLLLGGAKMPFELLKDNLKIMYPVIDNTVFPYLEYLIKENLAPKYDYN